jgi:hypothetical protein
MSTHHVEHTYSISAVETRISWSLTVGPRTNDKPRVRSGTREISFQVIIELTPPSPAQLEFEF